jgi:hypothetical protein
MVMIILPPASTGTAAEIRVQPSSSMIHAPHVAPSAYMVFRDGSATLIWPETDAGPIEESPSAEQAAWPPPWFGAVIADRTDTAARTEDILREEFGRNDPR